MDKLHFYLLGLNFIYLRVITSTLLGGFSLIFGGQFTNSKAQLNHSVTAAVLDGILSPPVFMALSRYSGCIPCGWLTKAASVKMQ